jgi:hypothetical protein
MSLRTRKYVLVLVAVVLTLALSRLARAGDWGEAEFYAAVAGLIAVVVLVGLPWMEYAPDGAFRRRPQT